MRKGDLFAVDKNKVDVSQAFAAYLAFAGDVQRAAFACNLAPEVMQALAVREGWKDKLGELHLFAAGAGGQEGLQRQINRAVNYVQAHRLRAILDNVISELSQKPPSELIELLTRTTKSGTEFTTRPLADLAHAVAQVQQLTMRALGDAAGAEESEGARGKKSDVGLLVMNAMNAAEVLQVSSADVVRREFVPTPQKLVGSDEKR